MEKSHLPVEVIVAAKKARCHDFIMNMSDGHRLSSISEANQILVVGDVRGNIIMKKKQQGMKHIPCCFFLYNFPNFITGA